MVQKIQIYQKIIADTFRRHPRRYIVLGVFLFSIAGFAAVLWPRQVVFSYAGRTCFYQPMLAPQLLQSTGDSFRLQPDRVFSIGNVAIAASRMCVVPIAAPAKGISTARLSLLGVPLQKSYTIHVTSPPNVTMSSVDAPVPTSKPLVVRLSAQDAVYTYQLTIGNGHAPCVVEGVNLSCALQQLELKQGTIYDVHIDRYFAGKHAGTVAMQKLKTLSAITVVGSSITQNQTVYTKPTSINLTVDKELKSVAAHLYQKGGASPQEVKVVTSIKSKTVQLSWQGELPRQAMYELELTATGNDGSALDGTYKLGFVTSGGPRVTNVSVGTYKVSLGSMATITFDQPIADTQNVSQVIAVTGGARVTSKQGNRVLISFSDVPRCGDVTIKVADGLMSNYGVSGGSAWSYTTRTICQQQSSIGTSVNGRQITAYSFGSGPNSIVFTGAIHGNETGTKALMLRWVDELEANARSIPADKTIIVIPALNPDGVAAGSRTNVHNVDLNRNFPTADWKSDITTTSNLPFPGGGGMSPLSEPESQAIANYIGRIRPKLVLSYHSIGGLLAANQAGDSSSRATTYASLSGYTNTTGATNTFDYDISGTADDYYAEAYGVPSLLIELGSHTDPQFSRNQKAMWAMVK